MTDPDDDHPVLAGEPQGLIDLVAKLAHGVPDATRTVTAHVAQIAADDRATDSHVGREIRTVHCSHAGVLELGQAPDVLGQPGDGGVGQCASPQSHHGHPSTDLTWTLRPPPIMLPISQALPKLTFGRHRSTIG